MHITIMAFGSRGDVQPYVALGAGLQAVGCGVRLAAPARFEALAAAHDLEFVPIPGDIGAMARDLVERAGSNPLRAGQVILAHILPIAIKTYESVVYACAGADAIVHSMLMTSIGHLMARRQGIPDFSGQLFPIFASTRAFAGPAFPPLPLGSLYNTLTHQAFTQSFRWMMPLLYGWLRRQHPHLPPLPPWPFTATNPHRPPLLYAFSRHVIPKPPDWDERVHITGYWFLDDADWQPPPALAEFLAAGPPPVYIGFGSMIADDMAGIAHIVIEALARAGQRGILLGGWGRLGHVDLPDSVLCIEAAPHGWLFPRMAAVVHHGGAGTTGAGLRAGVPSIIVPFTSDQPFWAARVQALGVGPAPISRKALTAEKLAYAMRIATAHAPMRARAAALGEKIRAEDGVGQAVQIMERRIHGHKSVSPRH